MSYTSGCVKKTNYYTKIENEILSATDLVSTATFNAKATEVLQA